MIGSKTNGTQRKPQQIPGTDGAYFVIAHKQKRLSHNSREVLSFLEHQRNILPATEGSFNVPAMPTSGKFLQSVVSSEAKSSSCDILSVMRSYKSKTQDVERFRTQKDHPDLIFA